MGVYNLFILWTVMFSHSVIKMEYHILAWDHTWMFNMNHSRMWSSLLAMLIGTQVFWTLTLMTTTIGMMRSQITWIILNLLMHSATIKAVQPNSKSHLPTLGVTEDAIRWDKWLDVRLLLSEGIGLQRIVENGATARNGCVWHALASVCTASSVTPCPLEMHVIFLIEHVLFVSCFVTVTVPLLLALLLTHHMGFYHWIPLMGALLYNVSNTDNDCAIAMLPSLMLRSSLSSLLLSRRSKMSLILIYVLVCQ